MIPVTKSFIPPLAEYQNNVKRAFDKAWLTNRGELVVELEKNISNYLGSSLPIAMCNGTVPIQMALKSLKPGKEIITTPFSYIATS